MFHTRSIIGTYLLVKFFILISIHYSQTSSHELSDPFDLDIVLGVVSNRICLDYIPRVFDNASIVVDINALTTSKWNRSDPSFSLMIL